MLAFCFCLLAPQQLQVSPLPGEVGREVVVKATRGDAPLADLPIVVRLPDGSEQSLGQTAADGTVRFVAAAAGSYVFAAEVEGVEVLAPHPIVAARNLQAAAYALVPLGLALAWVNLRRKHRAAAPTDASHR
ncbi:MAG: hypothetical protein RL398_2109 [Planctomycetota bacterium]